MSADAEQSPFVAKPAAEIAAEAIQRAHDGLNAGFRFFSQANNGPHMIECMVTESAGVRHVYITGKTKGTAAGLMMEIEVLVGCLRVGGAVTWRRLPEVGSERDFERDELLVRGAARFLIRLGVDAPDTPPSSDRAVRYLGESRRGVQPAQTKGKSQTVDGGPDIAAQVALGLVASGII